MTDARAAIAQIIRAMATWSPEERADSILAALPGLGFVRQDESSETDDDLQQCEHCDKEFPIETMTMMEDCWFCAGCVAEWRAIFDACEHEWDPKPYVDTMGDEGRVCNRCNGFVVSAPEPTQASETPT